MSIGSARNSHLQTTGVEPTSGSRPGPLSGIRVLDLTAVILGAYATMLLGDMGADVLKIEHPGGPDEGGDIMRWSGECPSGPNAGMGPLFMLNNRNKRSVTLDLKTPEGRAACLELAKTSDVFASNMRYKSLKKLGLSYEDIKAVNPDIVYVHSEGFGTGGPYEGLPAYDDLVQAVSGSADLLPRTDGNPQPRILPTLAADKTVGLFMVNAVLAALVQKQRTGQGQFVEVPMFECYTHFLMSENLYGHVFDPPRGDYGYGRVLNPNRRPYKTQDGWIAITPYSERNWEDFFDLAGRKAEFIADPRFATHQSRTANIATLYAMIEQITVSKTTDQWLELLIAKKVPAMRVNRLDQVMDDPHLKAVDFFQHAQHPSEGAIIDMRHPVKFSQADTPTRHPAPRLGEHTEEVLATLRQTPGLPKSPSGA